MRRGSYWNVNESMARLGYFSKEITKNLGHTVIVDMIYDDFLADFVWIRVGGLQMQCAGSSSTFQ